MLFARAGTPHCWECGREIASQTPSQIVDAVMKYPAGTKVMILSPLVRGQKGEHKDIFGAIHKQGFVRRGSMGRSSSCSKPEDCAGAEEDVRAQHRGGRRSDRAQAGDPLAPGRFDRDGAEAVAGAGDRHGRTTASERGPIRSSARSSPARSIRKCQLPELEPRLFSFNSPHGACPECHGLGTIFEFDPELIVPDEALSLENGAIEAWRKNGKRMNIYYSRVLRQFCRDFGDQLHRSRTRTSPKRSQHILMYGTDAKGDIRHRHLVRRRHSQSPAAIREHRERMGARRGCTSTCREQPCETCCGTRLKKEALAVRLHTLDRRDGSANASAMHLDARDARTTSRRSTCQSAPRTGRMQGKERRSAPQSEAQCRCSRATPSTTSRA